MQVGRIVYGNNKKWGKHQLVNIGDYFQTFGLDALYANHADPVVSKTNIERHTLIKSKNLTLPLNGVFTRMIGRTAFPLHGSVTPLFFGYNNTSCPNHAELDAYAQAGVVGCRDEATFNRLKTKGVNAYISGCTTLALPQRNHSPKNAKVFLVDTPLSLENHLPKIYAKNAVRLSQEIAFFGNNTPQLLSRIEAYASLRLKQYKDEASLVITSRLHCAAPCIAMGIPVILVREYFDDRYAFIDKFLPLYTPSQFSQINWHPTAPNIDEARALLTYAFVAATAGLKNAEAFDALHTFYMQRKRMDYHTPLKTKLFYMGLNTLPKPTTYIRNKVLKKLSILQSN